MLIEIAAKFIYLSQSIVTVFSITLHTDMLMYYKYMLFSIFDISYVT